MSNEGVNERVIIDFLQGRSSAAALQSELAPWIGAVTEIPVIEWKCAAPPFAVAISDIVKAIDAVKAGQLTPEALACLAGVLIASRRFVLRPEPDRRLLAALFHICNDSPSISGLDQWRRRLLGPQ